MLCSTEAWRWSPFAGHCGVERGQDRISAGEHELSQPGEGDDKVCERTLEVQNALGLHARAASKLVQCTNKFKSEVTLEKDGTVVNGKSIMGVLMLAAGQGSQVTVRAEGGDSTEAMQAVEDLFRIGFHEGVGK